MPSAGESSLLFAVSRCDWAARATRASVPAISRGSLRRRTLVPPCRHLDHLSERLVDAVHLFTADAAHTKLRQTSLLLWTGGWQHPPGGIFHGGLTCWQERAPRG